LLLSLHSVRFNWPNTITVVNFKLSCCLWEIRSFSKCELLKIHVIISINLFFPVIRSKERVLKSNSSSSFNFFFCGFHRLNFIKIKCFLYIFEFLCINHNTSNSNFSSAKRTTFSSLFSF
jgi:hypothetical protein